MLQRNEEDRYISRLTQQTLALIMAGGQGSRLHELTKWRAKPAVPFGGKFRIIDFALSNCVNSGIRRIGVLTQYKAHSLIRHLNRGWSRFNTDLGEFVEILPASQRVGGEWYRGTADSLYQNIDIIRSFAPEYVLVLGGDHIYKMDYGAMIAAHVNSAADLTVCCVEVPVKEAANNFGVMGVDSDSRVLRFQEKPAQPDTIPDRPDLALASMGNYVFGTEFLIEQLIDDAHNLQSQHDFGRNIIPSLIAEHKVIAFPFRDADESQAYWRDVGTIDAYWNANMELVEVVPPFNIYDDTWPILTNQTQLPPAKFVFDEPDRRGLAIDSMVSGGCIVSGAQLRRSLLFSDVHVESYTEVEDCVVLPEVTIGEHCRIRKAVIDRGAKVPAHSTIGYDHDADRSAGFRVTEQGVVLVTPDMLNQPLHALR